MGRLKQDRQDLRPMGSTRSWARTPGTLISGQASIDGVDALAIEMEERWGAGRLRLLVGAELREKFDRQRYLFNQAIWHGDLADVQREAVRMNSAWMHLDRVATAAQAQRLRPEVWEVALPDGTVAAIVRRREDARAVVREGREVIVYTLEELARLLANYHEVMEVKAKFPGALVTEVRRSVEDPLNQLRDSDLGFEDQIPSPDVGLN